MNEGVGASSGAFWRDADGTDAAGRYGALLASVDACIFQLEPSGQFAGANGALTAATGYDRESLLDEHVSVLAADGGAELERVLEQLRSAPSADIAPLEIGIETATGERRHWDLRLNPIVEADDLVGIAGVAREVSDQEAERRSQQHRRVMRALEASREGISLLDADGTFIYVNDAYAETFGYGSERMVGEHWEDLGIEAEPEQFTENVLPQIADEGQWSGTTTCVRNDGSTFLAQHSLTHTDDEELICVVRDVSDERQRQRELERQERIIETLGDGVYAIDEEAAFVMANDAFCEMVGWEREELLGQPSTVVYDDEIAPAAAEQADAVAAGEQDVATLEFQLVRKDGGTVPVEARFRPFPGDDGDGRCGVVRDITEQVERERKLEESNERLEQFAYAASHDLQEPLRMVSSYLTLIEDRYGDELDEDGQEFLEFAVDGAERMRDMIHGLLDYSRVETRGDPFEPVDLEAVFADVRADLELCIEESGAEVTAESLPTVEGDRGQLYQLLQNLLVNAVEYSGDTPPRVHVSAERRGAAWAVSVADEGVGMDPDQADRAFELFQRLHPQNNDGTGIGLALCERIVERHGGDIRVDSEPNEGTTFTFTLPTVRADDV